MKKETLKKVQQQADNLDGLPTPVVAIDKDYNVTYMNNVGAGLVGMTTEEVKGKKCYDLFKTPHCNTSECRCAQAMQNDGELSNKILRTFSLLPLSYCNFPCPNFSSVLYTHPSNRAC